MTLGPTELKSGIVLLWALWFSLVTLLNVCDALRTLRVLPTSWAFASGNFAFMQATTKVYRTPDWLTGALFAGVIVWEVLATWLLWRAWVSGDLAHIDTAFVVSLALWGAFILADELFLAFFVEGEGSYSVAATHRSLFTAFLVSLMAIHLL